MPVHLKQTAWKLVRHLATEHDLGCVRRLMPAVNVDSRQVARLLDEVVSSPELRAAMDSPASRSFDGDPGASATRRLERQAALAGAGRGRLLLLYVTARLLRPECVVETGCFTGWDSAVILQALARNGAGHLYSIDLPARDGRFSQRGRFASLPTGLSSGFLVPPAFRDRWTLIEGDVRDELMPLLQRLRAVDLFLHDSDHSYPQMMWEYTALLPHMAPGAVMVSDDISWNTAFWDFAAALGRRPVIHRGNPNVGAIAVPPGGTP
jgi:predicted O-methyltransferase YrrM